MLPAILIVWLCTVATMLLSFAYFQRYRLTLPPIGVINGWDVGVILTGIVVAPYLYLALPTWLAILLLGGAIYSLLTTMGEPLLRPGWRNHAVALLAVGIDSAAVGYLGASHATAFAINNLVLLAAIIGITNLWAQGGIGGRHIAILAGALTLYDVLFTAYFTTTSDLIDHLAALPFAPLIRWSLGDGRALGLGLGDVIIASLTPLVLAKAFGRSAGITALILHTLILGALLLLPILAPVAIFPVMLVLGPLTLAQYSYWVRRVGPEHTTWQYRQAQHQIPS